MNVVVFIQARMGSTRLPGKVMARLGSKLILDHVIDRVLASGTGEPIVLTTLSRDDLPVVRHCAARGIRVFCGSENDVLDRFWQASKLLDPAHVVRITADCPVLDPAVLRRVVERHLATGADYTSNVQTETFPDGLDCEVFTTSALETAWREAILPSDREHVTPFLRKDPQRFRQASIEHSENLGELRWTLDTPADFGFLTSIFAEMPNPDFGMDEILDLLRRRPELGEINGNQIRNAGYILSLHKDGQDGK